MPRSSRRSNASYRRWCLWGLGCRAEDSFRRTAALRPDCTVLESKMSVSAIRKTSARVRRSIPTNSCVRSTRSSRSRTASSRALRLHTIRTASSIAWPNTSWPVPATAIPAFAVGIFAERSRRRGERSARRGGISTPSQRRSRAGEGIRAFHPSDPAIPGLHRQYPLVPQWTRSQSRVLEPERRARSAPPPKPNCAICDSMG